eukprot:3279608-Prymnesium_polylepis.3
MHRTKQRAARQPAGPASAAVTKTQVGSPRQVRPARPRIRRTDTRTRDLKQGERAESHSL